MKLSKINFNIKNIKKIPLTIAFIFLFSFFTSIKEISNNNLNYFSLLFVFLIVNTLFVEIAFYSKKKRLIGYLLSICLSILLNQILSTRFFVKCDISCNNTSNLYFILSYIIFMSSLIVFIIFKKSKLNFYKYINIVLNNIFNVTIIYIFCLLCTVFLFALLELLGNINTNFFQMFQTLLFGLYFLPSFIISFINIDNKISKLYKIICLCCIIPFFILCTSIIYFYIIRLLITKTLPSNLIFILVLFVFIFGIIAYFILKEEKNKFSNIYCTLFIYISILPILLQIYSLFIRISSYGLTEDRYISYLIIVEEILMLILLKYKNGFKIQNILLSLSILCIISNFTPFNMTKLSNISQKNILNKYYNSKDNSKAVSAYNYLKKSKNGKKYISKEIDNKMKKTVNKNDVCNHRYKYYTNKFDEINIKNYNSIKSVRNDYNYNDVYDKRLINQNTEKYEITVNIKDYLNEFLDNDLSNKELLKEYTTIKIDENTEFYVTYLYLVLLDTKEEKIEKCNIRGFLLTR